MRQRNPNHAGEIDRATRASIDSFLKTYLGSKVVILTLDARVEVHSDQVLIAPLSLTV